MPMKVNTETTDIVEVVNFEEVKMNTLENAEVVEVAEVAVIDYLATDHSEVREGVLDARRKIEESYWEFSIRLHDVYINAYYTSWGFNSFVDYIELEVGMNKRKAQYLVSIQDWFGKMNPQVQTFVKEIGWTKAKELVGKVDNNNASEMIPRLEGKSYRELMNTLNVAEESSSDQDPINDVVEDKPTKVSFALFEDQKKNVDQALEVARDIASSDSNNHALDMICLEFISSHQMSTVDEYLAGVERLLNLKLIAYDKSKDQIAYGTETLDSLIEEDED